MKAAVWYAKGDVRIEEVAEPSSPPTGWVKVKVHACGICGSDLHEYATGPVLICADNPHPLTGTKSPLIIGHEFSGEVVERGEFVGNVEIGARVAGMGGQICGECYYCEKMELNRCVNGAYLGFHYDGAFAEYVNVPAYSLFTLPENVSSQAGALVEPFAVGLHAVRQGSVSEGDTVVVLGAGPVGLATLQTAVAEGAERVFVLEMADSRKKLALQMGATAVIDPREVDPVAEIQKLTDGLGADVAIECIGSEKTAPLAVALIRKGGTAVMAGIFSKDSTINFLDVAMAEKRIVGSFGYFTEFPEIIEWFAEGKLNPEPMLTGTVALDDIVKKGFDELLSGQGSNIKIIVEP